MAKDSSSASSSDDEATDRIKYLKAKIAKLERKKKKMDKKEKRVKDKRVSESSEGEGVPVAAASNAREDWMTSGDVDNLVFPCVSIAEVKAERKKEREERLYKTDAVFRSKVEARKLLENPGSHQRELNPFWKEGGTGLPSEDQGKGTLSADLRRNIGDGGSTWLRRAFKRAQEMAEEQKKPVEEIIAQRWGSVEKLEEMMSAAEGRTVRLDLNRTRSSRDSRDEERESRYKRPSLDDADDDRRRKERSSSHRSSGSKSWKKATEPAPRKDDEPSKQKSNGNKSKLNEELPSSTSSSSSSSSQPPKAEQPMPESEDDYLMTPAEMNALGAKILKAELCGKKALAAQLQAKLDKAREVSKGKRIIVETKPREEKTNQQRQTGKMAAEMHQYRFDDRYSLKGMFEAEKQSSDASDGDRACFAKMSARAAKQAAVSSQERVQPDEWDEESAGVEKVDSGKSAKKAALVALKSAQSEERRAMALENVQTRQLETCRRCFESPQMIKHLMIAMGSFAYLSLPGYESLAEGHCLISPLSHVPSSLDADENVWEEIRNFGRSLSRMFKDRGEDSVFFEYFRGTKSKGGFPHLTIECVPLPPELGDQAPIYFKKALLECENEWTQNKKVVDIPRGRDVRSVIPKGLPYFFVSFAWDEVGFAHVIEDEQAFPSNFAQEIIGGMTQADPRLWRKPRWEDFDTHCAKVESFTSTFSKYDWTSPS